MSAKVKKVVIQIGQKEITLDVEEAKALKEALDGLFAQAQVVTIPQPYPVPVQPYPVPVQPYRWDWPWWQGTLCGGADNGDVGGHGQGVDPVPRHQ